MNIIMCGIAGVYGWTDDTVMTDMLSCIQHRGPDEGGSFVDETVPVMMGTRRLSIIDLAGGSQPMTDEDGTVVVCFNGEIYNHERLRSTLEEKGHTFCSESDTEVLVHLWEEHGREMPTHLDGMFALAIWDEERDSLFLCRDRLGIKPLYYATPGESVVWGSEVTSLLAAGVDKTIDSRAVRRYFSFRFAPWPATCFEWIQKLPPGGWLELSPDGLSQGRYWSLTPNSVDGSVDQVATEIRDRLADSVRHRMLADVDVGAFLSGGLDSTAVVGLMSNYTDDLKTFSVRFASAATDESEEARYVADHYATDHHEITVDLDSMDLFETAVRHYGEPLADPAVMPTMLLSEHASELVKVVQTGEGADELFAGYRRLRMVPRHRKQIGWLPRPAYRLADRLDHDANPLSTYFRYLSALRSDDAAILWGQGTHSVDEQCFETATPTNKTYDDLFEEAFTTAAESPLQRMESFEFTYTLPDKLLYKVDHATMAASLEARVPFLDHRLVEYVHGVPTDMKVDSSGYKPLFKQAVSDFVPERILERSKMGFSPPVSRWFRDGHPTISKWLSAERIEETPLLDTDGVFKLWDAHRRGNADNTMMLWKLLNYIAWYHIHCTETEARQPPIS